MVRVVGPCYSLTAQGWLGRVTYGRLGMVVNPYPIAIVNPYLMSAAWYSRQGWVYQRRRTWHGIIWSAIRPPISAQPKTAAQQANKYKFGSAVHVWQGMNEETKDYYHHLRYPPHPSGYNRFIRMYMLDKNV